MSEIEVGVDIEEALVKLQAAGVIAVQKLLPMRMVNGYALHVVTSKPIMRYRPPAPMVLRGDDGLIITLDNVLSILGYSRRSSLRDEAHGASVRGSNFLSFYMKSEIGGTGTAGNAVNVFCLLYFKRLRDIVCSKSRHGKDLSKTAAAAINLIVLWLMKLFGIAELAAQAIAIAIVTALLSAGKGAFCDMTDKKAKSALKKRVTSSVAKKVARKKAAPKKAKKPSGDDPLPA